MRTVRIRVYGRVQGVGFRYYTLHTARILGITGYVRNEYDGSVEIVSTGEDSFHRRVHSEGRSRSHTGEYFEMPDRRTPRAAFHRLRSQVLKVHHSLRNLSTKATVNSYLSRASSLPVPVQKLSGVILRIFSWKWFIALVENPS